MRESETHPCCVRYNNVSDGHSADDILPPPPIQSIVSLFFYPNNPQDLQSAPLILKQCLDADPQTPSLAPNSPHLLKD